MSTLNLQFAWCWFLAGALSGGVHGLYFRESDWMGGYGSWRRRLTRLGHVAFFGTGLLNLCFFLVARTVALPPSLAVPASALLLVGAATMPPACYLAAWRNALYWLFPLPVLSLVGGIGLTAIATFAGAA